MTDYSGIRAKVRGILRKYKSTDPFEVCTQMGIKVLFHPMGSGEHICRGFFLRHCRIGVITVNSELSGEMQRIICAHELGHAILHREEAGFQDISLFRTADVREQEANLFAAELLLSDESVLSVLNQDLTFFEAAALLRVPVELLDFKFRLMKWHGCQVIDTPIKADSRCLRKIRDGGTQFDTQRDPTWNHP